MIDPVSVSAIATAGACGFAKKMGEKAAEKYGDSIMKSAENTAKKVVETVDKGWESDYNAGGISRQLNKNSTQTA
jgi:hypothetical protein